MTMEKCLSEAKEEREAKGEVDGNRVKIRLDKTFRFLQFPYRWGVHVNAYDKFTHKHFIRRSSADSYFDKLVKKYGLEEEIIHGSEKSTDSQQRRTK